ncbi:DUF2686 family protein [Escherichia coli]|uniref:DUF2686 family protein n=1 Tax=Escherichia coli TaxID=562 RepID=UPI001365CDFB|nr:DUF2686 family protein [Escherichia coli]MWT70255.1 DUF2686 family protein [Escherichia coli]
MSVPISNAANNQIFTDNHFAHHPTTENVLTQNSRMHSDTNNIYVKPLTRGNNHNYDGGSVVEIRQLEFGNKEDWTLDYVTGACQEADGITTLGSMLDDTWEASSVLDEIYGGVCKKAHASVELEAELRMCLSKEPFFDTTIDYTLYEITLGPGCNVPGYAGTTIGYFTTIPIEQVKFWTNKLPGIDIYISTGITVAGVSNASGFAHAALLNANPQIGNNPTIGIAASPGTELVHSRIGYKVIPGDENKGLKRMTLQPASLPELFKLNNGEWNYIGK